MHDLLLPIVIRWITCFVVVAVAVDGLRADASPTNPPIAGGQESLGGRLMDGLPVGPAEPSSDPKARTPGRGASRGNSLLDAGGEDVGGPSGPLPLVRAEYGMREAEALLAAPDTAAQARDVQAQVVAELDTLIEQLSKQCQSCARQGGQQSTSASQRSKTIRKPAGGKPGRGVTPARDSTDRLDRASARPIEEADLQQLLKNLWGHLPERVREQMLQSYSDEFLPEYELEIEKYYRRLAEEPDDGAAD